MRPLDFMVEARVAFALTRPTSHMVVTGITDDYLPPARTPLYTRYTLGTVEARRDNRRLVRERRRRGTLRYVPGGQARYWPDHLRVQRAEWNR